MLNVLQDWTTISGSGNGANSLKVTQTASDWLSLEDASNIVFWLEVSEVVVSSGLTAVLTYETSPTADESFFMTLGSVVMAPTTSPIVTKARLADNPAVALGRFVRWSITVQGASTVWDARFRIFYAVTSGVEGPRGIPGDTSGFRLTMTSGTPVTTVDTVGSTIYFTPFNHSQIVLSDGVSWRAYNSDEIAFAPAMGVNSTYDIFAYYDPVLGVVALEVSAAWTSDTVRTDPVSRVNGVLVKTVDVTRRLVGTIRTDANGHFLDTVKQRFVWNAKNQVDRFLSTTESTANWLYASATYRAAHGVTANSFEYVTGDVAALHVYVHALAIGNAAGLIATTGVGVDSTTVNSAQIFGKTTETAGAGSDSTHADYQGYTAAGHHTITWLESASATITFFGTNGAPPWQTSGMNGKILA
jgi:hypothetical protein